MKKKETLFKELTGKEKKYTSIIDEYRRIYQTGEVVKIKNKTLKDRNEMFELGIKFIIKNLKSKLELKDIFVGQNFIESKNNGYKKAEVVEFKNNENEKVLAIEVTDKNNNILKTSFSIIAPSTFSRLNKIQYYERYKFNKTLFGLSDSYKKILLKKRCQYKAAILIDNICKKLNIEVPDWASYTIKKIKAKGEISVN